MQGLDDSASRGPSTSASLWDAKSRPNAQKLIDELLQATHDSGIAMSNLAIRIALEELASILPASKSRRGLLVGTITGMKASDKSSVEDFEVMYAQALEKEESTRPDPVLWTFLVPVHAEISKDLEPPIKFTVFGTDLKFITREDLAADLDDPQVLRDPKLLSIELGRLRMLESIPEVYLICSHNGTSWRDAWAGVGPTAFDPFRGMVELIYGFRGWRWGTEMPRTRIPLVGWMIAKTAESKLEGIPFISGNSEDFRLKTFQLDREAAERIHEHTKMLSEKPESSRSTLTLIGTCLRLYSEAMDAPWNYECLLAFWQLAEALTLSDSFGGDTRTVASRLARFGEGKGLAGSGYRHALRRIAHKRNDIVHRGIYDRVADEDVNILKLASEEALLWLIRTHSELPTTSHLNMYYRFCDSSDISIEAAKDAITYIQSQERDSS